MEKPAVHEEPVGGERVKVREGKAGKACGKGRKAGKQAGMGPSGNGVGMGSGMVY
jgi:hypothetical protein